MTLWQPSTGIWTPPQVGPIPIPPCPPKQRENEERRRIERDTRPMRSPHTCPSAWREWRQDVMPIAIVAQRRVRNLLTSNAPSKASLVAYWNCDDASGANFADATGNGHTLTQHNTVGSAAGVINTSRSFVSASSMYGDGGTGAWASFTTDFTAFGWIYPTVTPTGNYYGILIKGFPGDNSFEYNIGLAPTGIASNFTGFIEMPNGSNAGQSLLTLYNTNGTLNAWNFVVGKYVNSTRVPYISFNGGVFGAGTTLPSAAAHNQGDVFRTGQSLGLAFLDGRLDEMGLANVAFTDLNAAWLYNGGAGEPLSAWNP